MLSQLIKASRLRNSLQTVGPRCLKSFSTEAGGQTNKVNQSNESKVNQKSFASLLRNSAFVGLGDLRKKRVSGVVIRAHEDDLYIDFGGKFHCVCKRPDLDPHKYVVGTNVVLLLHQYELSTRFLGSFKETTLLEADGTILYATDYIGFQVDRQGRNYVN